MIQLTTRTKLTVLISTVRTGGEEGKNWPQCCVGQPRSVPAEIYPTRHHIIHQPPLSSHPHQLHLHHTTQSARYNVYTGTSQHRVGSEPNILFSLFDTDQISQLQTGANVSLCRLPSPTSHLSDVTILRPTFLDIDTSLIKSLPPPPVLSDNAGHSPVSS